MEDQRKLIHVEGIELEMSGNHENEDENLSVSTEKPPSSGSRDSMDEFGTSWNQYGDERVTLAWRDVSVTANSKGLKRIIHNVSGAVKTGSLVALMGASGAGKSTLMTALAYRHPGNLLVEGDILVNGQKIGDQMKYFSGFMYQEDLFIGALTVLEHMTIMARIKLDRRMTAFDRQSKVYDILCQLNLVHCLNTRIGLNGEDKILSGGEKKRLAFATELLTDPPLLFCDEPTTGLDSYSAQKLVSMMNRMAQRGKTIVCTIHQPSSELFAMFSQILLVADGRIAFMGSTQNALEFFKRMGYHCPSNYNPADFFIRTLALQPGFEETSKQTIKKICDNFAVSEAAKELEVVIQYEFHIGRSSSFGSFPVRKDFKRVFWWTSFYTLAYRGLLECIRDPRIQGLRMLQKIAIAVMVGFCYLGTDALTQSGIQSVQGAVFILTAENVFAPMYTVLNLFPQEFPLFSREYQNGLYPVGVYYLAKMIAILPGIVLEPVVFTIITYFMSGLRMSFYVIFATILIATLTMNVSIACGCFFSTLFGSVPTAMAYLVPFDVLLMVTQGVFVKLSSLPMEVSWVQYLSWLMYSTETMTILQWDGVSNITCEIPDPKIPCLTNGDEVLDKYSFEKSNFFMDIYAMILIYFGFHILALLCLWRRARKK